MKERLFSGILYIVLGFLTALGPILLFPVCGPMDDGRFMKCHWTGQAELGIGLVIGILGIILLLIKSKQIRIGIEIAIALQFVIVLLIPGGLIGVCGGAHMRCHSLTWPILNILGAIGILYAILHVTYLCKTVRKEASSK